MKVHKGEDTQLAWGHEATFGGSVAVDQWFGYGTEPHTPDESEGHEAIRYVGGTNRNFDVMLTGPKEYTGTITVNPQKGFMFLQALGTSSSTGSPSTPVTHTITESGTLYSFTIEDSQEVAANEHFTRKYDGLTIDSMTWRAALGEKVEQEINYVARRVYLETGAKTAVTAHTDKPYRFEECQLWISGGGIDGDTDSMKEWSWTINNNIDAKNYQDNSKYVAAMIPGDRDYEFTATFDATAGSAEDWYEKFFWDGGSVFNAKLFIFRTSGTDHVEIHMSGCRMVDCDQPAKRSGVVEQSWTVKPQTCIVTVKDSVLADGTDAYRA